MEIQQFKAITNFGSALWMDPDLSESVAAETISAVSLMNLNDEQSFERVTRVLLDRAAKNSRQANLEGISKPYFRLQPTERFLLMALHIERWSYERAGRVLDLNAEQVAEAAWAVRVHLASAAPEKSKAAYPAGASLGSQGIGASCPDYDSRNPWTQKFLDEELSKRQQIFLQNHMMACDSCRKALGRCRDMYYAVDAMVPRVEVSAQRIRVLERAWKHTRAFVRPLERSVWDTLRIFMEHRDVQIVVGLAAGMVAVEIAVKVWKAFQ